eukprot:CAMPEP_0170538338 /NCGR_PEP_ID=MMETSP0209-20121228/103244_1 /TAXON_ID=665100 ORGANISM="Litonotus pictus, Strain P1" /NCGR_SAMPLE_ID=MMETSP0209 /ASSEMBLY_ACC=CAM_ASM_000301 /LENGTH=301 /DNA_ID=CAMNT_0010839999 /DNA_START=854 /DNA_END=1760 /DNA_ORIENTATION=+
MISFERCLKFTEIATEKALVLESDKDLTDPQENQSLKEDSGKRNIDTSEEKESEYFEDSSVEKNELNPSKSKQVWPTIGKVEFVNYSVRYRPNTDLVLKDIKPKTKDKIVRFNSLEKESEYIEESSVEKNELNLSKSKQVWPIIGKVEFVNYSVRYRPNTDLVLKDINFLIKPGQRVGVVGRTGSGKSTLCLSLFRILEPTEGTIFIDNVDICNIGLFTLRSGLTIIPQDPSLMKGTLRYNIDPMKSFEDSTVLSVIKKIGLTHIIEENKDGLDQLVSDSGTNLSVGEKQRKQGWIGPIGE